MRAVGGLRDMDVVTHGGVATNSKVAWYCMRYCTARGLCRSSTDSAACTR